MPALAPILLALHLAAVVRAPAPVPPPDSAAVRALRGADALFVRGRFDSCLVLAAPFAHAAGGALAPRVRARALTMVAAAHGMMGRPAESERDAGAAMELAFASGDSVAGRLALRWLAFSHLARARWSMSTPLYRRLLALSQPHAEWSNIGYAHMGIAYEALLNGRLDEARRGYRQSIAALQRARDRWALRQATIGLARVSNALGDYEEERRIYLGLLRDAEREGDLGAQGQLQNNLGVIEYSVGDPSRALAHWRRALALRGSASPSATATPRTNIALALLELGRNDEAVAGLDSLAAECRAAGLRSEEVDARLRIVVARMAQERWEECWTECARALALLDSVPQSQREAIVLEAWTPLTRLGRVPEALALLERERTRPFVTPGGRAEMDARLAALELRRGRPRRALVLARAALAESPAGGVLREHVVRPLIADAWRALGQRDSSLAEYERAAAAWEASRRAPSDPEWRERRGLGGLAIFGGLAKALLEGHTGDPAAVRDAFDRLQRFKARTLLERMAGPGRDLAAGVRPPATAAEVMRVLAPGEVLLDYFDGPDSALVFAVDRRSVTMAWIVPGRRLHEKVAMLNELYADASGDPARHAVRGRSATSMGALAFGGVAGRLRRATSVVLAPDGAVHRLPLESLPVPGEGRPLGEGRDVWRVPSATLLVELRSRPAAAPGRGMLALAAERDEAGRPLPGAAREVRALARRFGAVEARVVGAADARPPAAAELARFDVLHVAAHTSADDQRPWNSGVFLGAGEGGWLRAGAIAATPLRARLAVLAGCSSADGHSIAGEGVQGLTAAFLGAGVPTVVATLWEVDDRIVGRLTTAFYERLARGETAAAALRGARHDLRDRGGVRPADWAGFVLLGEGTTRVRLVSRPPAVALLAGLVAVLAALGAVGSVRRGRMPGGL